VKTDEGLNFLFILIDDLGWRDIGCYGSSFYETPCLDRLAQEGMRFTDAYAACPVCSPTRASILTGKYPARLGVTNWIGGKARGRLIAAPYVDHLALEEISLASALKKAGYRTYHVGKWHLGGEPFWPEQHGFDVNIGGGEHGAPRRYFSPYANPRLTDGPDGEYLTDRLTDEAIRLIENNGDQPFFMHLSHYAVHTPIQTPERYLPKYEAKARMLGLDEAKVFEEGDFFPCEHKRDKRIQRRLVQSSPEYAGMIQNLDENIERVLQALEASGQAERTVVLFTSDNGGLATAESSPTCNAPLSEGKGWMYEGGTREPLLVRWPGVVAPDSTCTAPVTSPDFYPTILEMAGADPMPEQHCDGMSLVPLLKGGESLGREAIYWHYPHYGNQGGTPGASIRHGDYKLIEFFEDDRVELYHLRHDVGEGENLAFDFPDLAHELQSHLHKWQHEVQARMPEPNPAWREE